MEPVKDRPTVTPTGEWLAPMIAGVTVRFQSPIEDERGEVVEMFRPAWGVHPDPLVYVYQVSIRPGITKGWVKHLRQDDRLFVSRGVARIGLYDDRTDSPTYRRLSVFTLSERRRALVVIPQGVFHGIQNVGREEMTFVNMPTRPYDHGDPDKLRLPLTNDLIPFTFEIGPGH